MSDTFDFFKFLKKVYDPNYQFKDSDKIHFEKLPANTLARVMYKNPRAINFINTFLNDSFETFYGTEREIFTEMIKKISVASNYNCRFFWNKKSKKDETYIELYNKLKTILEIDKPGDFYDLLDTLSKKEIEELCMDYIPNYSTKLKQSLKKNIKKVKGGIKKKKNKSVTEKYNIDSINEYLNQYVAENLCDNCRLLDESKKLCWSNYKTIDEVDILIVKENVTIDEMNNKNYFDTEKGMLVKNFLEKYNLGKKKVISINAVLCPTNDNKIKEEHLKNCGKHISKMIDYLNPKIILSFGSLISKYMINSNDKKFKITKENSQTYTYNNSILIPSVKPGFILRDEKNLNYFDKVFKNIQLILDDSNVVNDTGFKVKNNDNIVIRDNVLIDIIEKEGIAYYKLPAEYYDDKYKLVDIQVCYKPYKIIITFRNIEENKKVILLCHTKKKYCYIYKVKDDPEGMDRFITEKPINEMKLLVYNSFDHETKNYLKSVVNNELVSSEILFDYDIPIDSALMTDYLLLKGLEKIEYVPKIGFSDIEVHVSAGDEFPDHKKAEHPINCLTWIVNDPIKKIKKRKTYYTTYLNKTYHGKNDEIYHCKTEKELLSRLINDMNNYTPDILTGWNFMFDIATILKRCELYNMAHDFCPLGKYELEFDESDTTCNIYGMVVTDMMNNFKALVQQTQTFYSLDYISKKFVGHGKVQYDGEYWDLLQDLDKFVDYNIVDTQLLDELEDKLQHLNLLNEMHNIFCCPWSHITGTIRPIISTQYMYAKKNKKTLRMQLQNKYTVNIKGAFVKHMLAGLYKYVIDLDFSSMYPSIMKTNNVSLGNFVAFIDNKLAFDYIYNNKKFKNRKSIKVTHPRYGDCYDFKMEDFLKFVENKIVTISGAIYIDHNSRLSPIYEIQTFFKGKRDIYKKKYKETGNASDNNGNKAYKTVMNGYYGAINTTHYNFADSRIAASITAAGIETIKFSALGTEYVLDYLWDVLFKNKTGELKINEKEFCEEFYKYYKDDYRKRFVFYTDTDSIFIELGEFIEKRLDYDKYKDLSPIDFLNQYVIEPLEKLINEDLIGGFYRKLHNLPEEHFYLVFKQEWIAKKLLSTGKKKKYSKYIIYEEGEHKDKVDDTGMETIRSETSAFTRKGMKYLLNRVLKEDDFNIKELKMEVDKKEEELKELCLKGDISICKVGNYNKNDYKVLPQHIRAMWLWNALVNDDFRKGQKGYIFFIRGIRDDKLNEEQKIELQKYLKKTNYKNLDVICLPSTCEKLPEIFVVDTERMAHFHWTNIMDRTFGNIFHQVSIDKKKIEKRMMDIIPSF